MAAGGTAYAQAEGMAGGAQQQGMSGGPQGMSPTAPGQPPTAVPGLPSTGGAQGQAPGPAGQAPTPLGQLQATPMAPAGGPIRPLSAPGRTPVTIPPDLAVRAAQAFDRGDFQSAASAYEQAVEAGVVNGHLFYDLGLVYFRQGRLGDSVAAFLAARRYLPRDPDVTANLRFVLADVHDKLEPERPASAAGWSSGWLDRVTAKELAGATSYTAAAAGLLLLLAQLVPALAARPWTRRVALAAFVVPLALGASLVLKEGRPDAWGAVRTGALAKVYSGPGKLNPVVFELQEGAPVLVTESVPGGFYRIELSDGKRGWIPDSDLRVFGPL